MEIVWWLAGAVCEEEPCAYYDESESYGEGNWICHSHGIGYYQYGCGYYHNYGTTLGDGSGNGYGYYDDI